MKWRSCFSPPNRQFRNLQPLRPRTARNLPVPRLMTELSTIPAREIGARPSAGCTRPCSPLPRPGNHETSILRFFQRPALSMSLMFILWLSDCESLLVRAAHASISNYDRGCRIRYGMLTVFDPHAMKLTVRIGEGNLQSGQQGRVEYGEPSAHVRVDPTPPKPLTRCLSSAKVSVLTSTITRRMG